MREHELKQVILSMLRAELDAMHFYQRASRFLADKDARYHFELLAQEELDHARTFHAVYPGDDLPALEVLISTALQQSDPQAIDPQALVQLTEKTALQLALKIENELADKLTRQLAEVVSPAAKAVIEENIDSTLKHYQVISEDYQRLFKPSGE